MDDRAGRPVRAAHVPLLTKAAADAGRRRPASWSASRSAHDRPAGAREEANRDFVIYGQLPSYRAMLDREGAANPGDIAIVGDEAALTAGVQRIKDAGATDLEVAPFGSPEEVDRTIEFLATRPAG